LLENASAAPWCLDDHVVHPGDSPNQWHIYEQLEDDPPLFTTGMGTRDDAELVVLLRNLAPDLLPIVEAALRAVPLSAEPAERERLLALDERVLALTLKGQPLTAADQSQVRSVIRQLLAAPTVAQAPQPSTRCPYCSFDPTSMNDYCAEHRPVRLEAPEGAAPAVSREATVPQGGEFTADEVDDAIESLRYAAGSYKAIRLLKRLRALSSAPGEREGR
jgi:hypothetical protein